MIIEQDDAVMGKIVEVLSAPAAGGIRQLMQSALDACMLAERRMHLGAGHYERTEERKDYANGFKDRSLKTRVGELQLRVPQVRSGTFYPSSLDRGMRSERALSAAMRDVLERRIDTQG